VGEVFNLALPYFGLILLGYVCGKLKRIPEAGLAWMNFFIIYVALPALFFRIVAKAPLEQLSNPRFIIATSLASFTAFAISFAIGMAIRHGNLAEATLAGLAGAYGNIGYMGPGLALATLGLEAAAPTALIFCFDSILLFSLVPFLMAFAGTERKGLAAAAADVLHRIALNPFIMATLAGVLAAAAGFEPPVAVDRLLQFLQNAAAPCALFTLGLTVALRPMKRLPWEVPIIIPVKLVVHPVLALTMLTLLGPFERNWVYTAVLMAALPPALNVFVTARHYDIWVEQASGFVLFGTAASVATLTTVMWLVTTQALPVALFR
jgi:malonate transporter